MVESYLDKYWKSGRRVLFLNAEPVISLIGKVPLEQIKTRAEHIMDTQLLRDYIVGIWAEVGSFFANDTIERLIQRSSKAEDYWEDAYRNYMSTRVAAKATSIARTQAGMINSVMDIILQEGFADGYSIEQIADKLQREVSRRMSLINDWQAERIARTEVIGASNKGSYDGALSSGLDVKKIWLTSGLQGVRASHAYYEGLGSVPMNFDYNIGLKHPGDPNGSAEEVINCYTGDLEIKSHIIGSQRSFYSGKIREIVTIGGKRITVTPNHNILTEHGFIKAGLINVGDNLVCNTEKVNRFRNMLRKIYNINNKISLIKDVFDSTHALWVKHLTPVGHLDFDGDGKFMQGNIDIVEANRHLTRTGKVLINDRGQFGLKSSRSKASLIKRFCSHNFGFDRVLGAPYGIMRFLNLALSLCGRHVAPFNLFSVGISSDLNSALLKMPCESNSWNTSLLGDFIHANPRLIHLDKVADVRDIDFSGHVYDFKSLTGTNIVNNIYTSNCRCTIIYET